MRAEHSRRLIFSKMEFSTFIMEALAKNCAMGLDAKSQLKWCKEHLFVSISTNSATGECSIEYKAI